MLHFTCYALGSLLSFMPHVQNWHVDCCTRFVQHCAFWSFSSFQFNRKWHEWMNNSLCWTVAVLTCDGELVNPSGPLQSSPAAGPPAEQPPRPAQRINNCIWKILLNICLSVTDQCKRVLSNAFHMYILYYLFKIFIINF